MTIHSTPSIPNKPLNELIKPQMIPGWPPMNNDELKTERQKDRTHRQKKLDFRSHIECRRMSENVGECRKRHENHSKDMIDISRQWQIHGQRQTQRQERWRHRRMSESQRVRVGHHNFWSIGLDDLWSRKICRPKMIVWSGAIFILRWSCCGLTPQVNSILLNLLFGVLVEDKSQRRILTEHIRCDW